MSGSQKSETIFDFFIQEISQIFGEEVVSIILYGSATTDEYIPKKSDINFLVILTQKGIEEIDKVHKPIKHWQKKRISLPLFLTQNYIHESLDSFPIEFLNMQSTYRILLGEDILKTIGIKKQDLRLQCERELKGKLLQLRQGFILTEGKLRGLTLLVSQSIIAFTSIFKGLLHLRGVEIPLKKHDVIIAACKEFNEIDEVLFSKLLSIREGTLRLQQGELKDAVKHYIAQIQDLTETVDKMKIK